MEAPFEKLQKSLLTSISLRCVCISAAYSETSFTQGGFSSSTTDMSIGDSEDRNRG